jgi:hypothetical protein
MSHQSFVAVWTQLETRTDVGNILCELIGQNSLESSVLDTGSDEFLNASLHLIVFFKVIFDLQRTYLQYLELSPESPHLLQPRQLFLAIIYLLRTKSRVFRRSEDTSEQYVTKRSFIAQALVSGLRALWLRKHSLSQDEITQLQSTFEEAWGGDKLNSLDSFLINKLCSGILDNLLQPSDPPSKLSYPACREVSLRDYCTGLVSALTSLKAITWLINEVSFGESPQRISHTRKRSFVSS